ncbi:hypothetical protein K503DRAFT_779659 [Rhizopogon vinicolor AM-OR11-026]|uniref:Uncharacterized protein n=1 Tax=Rhizopogon vinicolor AM-OR11-026 TaxID=1314800 RepID=A0A1B7ND45_9AGAM|nr:hypothetical protein K503DRAFT_779659 [Rhizopogon vinicolor AM-OR11-026]
MLWIEQMLGPDIDGRHCSLINEALRGEQYSGEAQSGMFLLASVDHNPNDGHSNSEVCGSNVPEFHDLSSQPIANSCQTPTHRRAQIFFEAHRQLSTNRKAYNGSLSRPDTPVDTGWERMQLAWTNKFRSTNDRHGYDQTWEMEVFVQVHKYDTVSVASASMGRQGGLAFQKQSSRRIDKGPIAAYIVGLQSQQVVK